MTLDPNARSTRSKQHVETLLPYTETTFTVYPEGAGADRPSELRLTVSVATQTSDGVGRKSVAMRLRDIPDEFEMREDEDGKPVRVKKTAGYKCPLSDAQRAQFAEILQALHLAAAHDLGFGE